MTFENSAFLVDLIRKARRSYVCHCGKSIESKHRYHFISYLDKDEKKWISFRECMQCLANDMDNSNEDHECDYEVLPEPEF